MSTGGNVPQQGVNIEQATTAKKRGHRGELGIGSPGKQLKGMHRKVLKTSGRDISLREFARQLASNKQSADEDVKVAQTWLLSKRSGGTDEQRKERKLRLKERRSNNLNAKASRKGGKQQGKKAA